MKKNTILLVTQEAKAAFQVLHKYIYPILLEIAISFFIQSYSSLVTDTFIQEDHY